MDDVGLSLFYEDDTEDADHEDPCGCGDVCCDLGTATDG